MNYAILGIRKGTFRAFKRKKKGQIEAKFLAFANNVSAYNLFKL